MGSWSYPEEAFSKIFGVPLYSGFMYASVASYICQSWRRLDLQIYDWPKPFLAISIGVFPNLFKFLYPPFSIRCTVGVKKVCCFSFFSKQLSLIN